MRGSQQSIGSSTDGLEGTLDSARQIPPSVTRPVRPPNEETEKRDIKLALIFGVVMATIEMAVVLALLYC